MPRQSDVTSRRAALFTWRLTSELWEFRMSAMRSFMFSRLTRPVIRLCAIFSMCIRRLPLAQRE